VKLTIFCARKFVVTWGFLVLSIDFILQQDIAINLKTDTIYMENNTI